MTLITKLIRHQTGAKGAEKLKWTVNEDFRVRTLELAAGNVGLTPRHLLTTPHSSPKSPSSKIRLVCQYTLEYKSIEYDTSPKHYQPAWRNKCLHLAKHDTFKNTIIVISSINIIINSNEEYSSMAETFGRKKKNC